MNRYHVMAGYLDYPLPGNGGYRASFNNYDEAKSYIDDQSLLNGYDWVCILWDDGYQLREAMYKQG